MNDIYFCVQVQQIISYSFHFDHLLIVNTCKQVLLRDWSAAESDVQTPEADWPRGLLT